MSWSALEAELEHWTQPPTLWWRDDDVRAHTPALDRLIAQSARVRAPLHLGVIPDKLSASLAPRLATAPHVWLMQHGRKHQNHEPVGAGASEIGEGRPLEAQRQDLLQGWRVLTKAGLPRLLPILAPPWNRIGAATARALPSLGYRLLSTHGPRSGQEQIQGLLRVNVHFDPIRWKSGPQFRGVHGTLKSLIAHLEYRRRLDCAEPTGFVTHHLQTDEETWAFQDMLLDFLAGRVQWLRLVDLLKEP